MANLTRDDARAAPPPPPSEWNVPDTALRAPRRNLMQALRGAFGKVSLKHVEAVHEKTLRDIINFGQTDIDEPSGSQIWEKADGKWRAVEQDIRLTRPAQECHGQCFGFSAERDSWEAPRLVTHSSAEARPGYNSCSASEYLDTDEVLRDKVKRLAELIMGAKCCVVYAGAGLSTSAGIGDYASKGNTANGCDAADKLRSPLCAQPTLAHRVLVGLHRSGKLHRIIQQNHDGLPQKAGMPQHVVNEIHGALHSPDNPVVPMSGVLRGDLLEDLLECEANADLTIAVGTSLCGMNADRVVLTPAAKAMKRKALGSVVIGLQRTVHDAEATLRIFGHCDSVFALLAEEMALGEVPPHRKDGEFFCPPVLSCGGEEAYLLQGLAYDAAGRHTPHGIHGVFGGSLDLREGAKLVITSGKHAGATGEVDSYDREGNPKCRFMVRLRKDKAFRVAHMLVFGTWWLQAAADGTVPRLPVVNEPDEADTCDAANELRDLCAEYSAH